MCMRNARPMSRVLHMHKDSMAGGIFHTRRSCSWSSDGANRRRSGFRLRMSDRCGQFDGQLLPLSRAVLLPAVDIGGDLLASPGVEQGDPDVIHIPDGRVVDGDEDIVLPQSGLVGQALRREITDLQ